MTGGAKNTTATIIQGLRYQDVTKAVSWLCRAFGFVEHMIVKDDDGSIEHAQLVFGNGMIKVGPSRDDEYGRLIKQPAEIEGAETQAPYLIVDDVDAHCRQARETGAVMVMEPEDQEYGGRYYCCRDPEGYLWNFGSYDPWDVSASSD